MRPTPEYMRGRRRIWAERVGYRGGRRLWTTSEQRLALDMQARGKTAFQIAMQLSGRTPDAVAARLRYVRHLSQPPGGRDAPQRAAAR